MGQVTREDVATRPQSRCDVQSELVLLAIWPDGRGHAFPLPERGRVSIGRSSRCDLPIDDEILSRTILGGAAGDETCARANADMLAAGVVAPSRIAAMLSPIPLSTRART